MILVNREPKSGENIIETKMENGIKPNGKGNCHAESTMQKQAVSLALTEIAAAGTDCETQEKRK